MVIRHSNGQRIEHQQERNLPRYAEFNTAVNKLANNGVIFNEISGNKGAIMLTVLTDKTLPVSHTYKVLFTQPIVTQPGLTRIALVTTVENLNIIIKLLLENKIIIEHVYDY